MNLINLGIIMGSTRPHRFNEKPTQWIYEVALKKPNIHVEILDLRDYPLPFYAEADTPGALKGNYASEIAKQWLAKIKTFDAYIIVTPEYNHGYPAVLKNALDYVYYEWNNKPVGFVSYGSVGGARSVEQLRQVCVELQLVPIRNAVHIAQFWKLLDEQGNLKTETFAEQGEKLLDQLLWWAQVLKAARG